MIIVNISVIIEKRLFELVCLDIIKNIR
jgi:hypothetical protein